MKSIPKMINSIYMRRTSFITILVYSFFTDSLCITILEKFFNNNDSALQSQFVHVYELKTIIKDTENVQLKQKIIIKDTKDKIILTRTIRSINIHIWNE